MHYRNIKRLFYTFAFFDDFILIYPLYGVMFSDKGLNASQISSLFIVWSLTAFLLEVPSGAIADKYPRRTVLFTGILMRALAFSCWLLMPNYVGFLLGFLLWGIKSAFASGTTEALVYDELKRAGHANEYTKVTGRMASLSLVGLILGGFVAAIFAKSGYGLVLVLSVAAVLISALAIYLLPRATAFQSTGETKYLTYLSEGMRLVSHNTNILFIIGFMAIVTGLGAVDEYYTLFFKQIGFDKSWIAFLAGITLLLGALGGSLAHKLEDKNMPLIPSLFVGAAILGLATVTPQYFAPVFIAFYIGYFYIVKVLFNAYLQKGAADKNRATMTSMSSLVAEIFALVVFGVFAVTAVPDNYRLGLQVIAAILAIAALIYAFLSKRYGAFKLR